MVYAIYAAFVIVLFIACWRADHAGRKRRKMMDEMDQAVALTKDPHN